MPTTDNPISGPYPGVTYDASELNFTYFEDREASGVLYRAQNATFDGLIWTQKDPLKASYGFAQQGDGSIVYLEPMPPGASPWIPWNAAGYHGFYDVREFGAIGDGIADDYAAIQSAATAAESAGGGTVYVPPGKYLISNRILLGDNTTFRGDARGASVLIAGPSIGASSPGGLAVNGNIMVANSQFTTSTHGQTWQNNIAVKDLKFDGNAPGNSRGSGNATIFFQGVNTVTIANCTIYSCANHGISVVSTPSTGMPTQGNVWIYNNTIDILPVRMYDPIMNKDVLTSGNIGIRLQALNGVFVSKNILGFNGPDPTVSGSPPYTWTPTWANDAIDVPGCNEVVVSQNVIQWHTDGVGFNNAINCVASGNLIYNCIGEGISSFAPSFLGVSFFNVFGNVIVAVPPELIDPKIGASNFAIRATSASPLSQYVSICDNVCVGPFATGAIDVNVENVTCSNNQIDMQGNASGGPYPGVGIYIKQNNCTVTGNTIRNQYGTTNAAAIRINTGPSSSPLTGIVVQGNNIDSTNTTPIQFQGLFPFPAMISENFGIVTYGAISQPAVPVTGVMFTNPLPFDCTVYLRSAGAFVTSVTIDGITTGYTSVLNGNAVCPFRVKCGGVITLAYTVATPSWTWLPD